jgi:hypothetical protein
MTPITNADTTMATFLAKALYNDKNVPDKILDIIGFMYASLNVLDADSEHED